MIGLEIMIKVNYNVRVFNIEHIDKITVHIDHITFHDTETNVQFNYPPFEIMRVSRTIDEIERRLSEGKAVIAFLNNKLTNTNPAYDITYSKEINYLVTFYLNNKISNTKSSFYPPRVLTKHTNKEYSWQYSQKISIEILLDVYEMMLSRYKSDYNKV